MIPKYLLDIQARLAALPDGRWSYDDGITDDRGEPVEQGKCAALYIDQTWVADLDTEMLPRHQKDACGRFLAHAKEDLRTLVNESIDYEHALDLILASCESVGFMREIDVPDTDPDDPAPIRTSRPTATVVAEMAAEVVRLRTLLGDQEADTHDTAQLNRIRTYLKAVADRGPIAAGTLALALNEDRDLMAAAVERFLLELVEDMANEVTDE